MQDVLKLPEGYVFDGEPVYHDTEDCMGRPQQYYSRTVKGPDGGLTIGSGGSPEEATLRVIGQVIEIDRFRKMPDHARMEKILTEAKQRRHIYAYEVIEALEIIWGRMGGSTG